MKVLTPSLQRRPTTIEDVECYVIDCDDCHATFAAEESELDISRKKDIYNDPILIQTPSPCPYCTGPLEVRYVDFKYEKVTLIKRRANGGPAELLTHQQWTIMMVESCWEEGEDFVRV